MKITVGGKFNRGYKNDIWFGRYRWRSRKGR